MQNDPRFEGENVGTAASYSNGTRPKLWGKAGRGRHLPFKMWDTYLVMTVGSTRDSLEENHLVRQMKLPPEVRWFSRIDQALNSRPWYHHSGTSAELTKFSILALILCHCIIYMERVYKRTK